MFSFVFNTRYYTRVYKNYFRINFLCDLSSASVLIIPSLYTSTQVFRENVCSNKDGRQVEKFEKPWYIIN